MKVVIIADDLTGALDSSVAFAQRGLRTVCALTVEHLPVALQSGAEVVAVSTGSREIPREVAVDRVRKAKAILAGLPSDQQGIWFKKIDSRLKGHVSAEISALKREGQSVYVAPAIPKLGRYVKDGALCGTGVPTPINVADKMGSIDSHIVDASSDSELDRMMEQMPEDALLTGAAGASAALARHIKPGFTSPALPELCFPALLAIGSTDPITLEQLAPFKRLFAPNGVVPAPTMVQDDILNVVQMVPGDDRVDGHTAATRFAEGIAVWVDKTRPQLLFATGGETATAIMEKFGCGLLDVRGEVLPGLPCAIAIDGIPGLRVVTKSGGFGAPETLVKFVDILVKE